MICGDVPNVAINTLLSYHTEPKIQFESFRGVPWQTTLIQSLLTEKDSSRC